MNGKTLAKIYITENKQVIRYTVAGGHEKKGGKRWG
jgi:hypothetical protein